MGGRTGVAGVKVGWLVYGKEGDGGESYMMNLNGRNELHILPYCCDNDVMVGVW